MTATVHPGFPGSTVLNLLGRRLRGAFDIDEWGLDPELIALSEPALSLRWDIKVTGADSLPVTGGALLVYNRHFGLSEPWVLTRGLRQSSGRFVRTVGVPDHAPVGPLLRRFGAVADSPQEIKGLLRAGQLVGLPTSRRIRERDVGDVAEDRLAAAVEVGVPIVPVALVGHEVMRSWRVVVGSPIKVQRRSSPPKVDEVAQKARAAVLHLLQDAAPAGWFY